MTDYLGKESLKITGTIRITSGNRITLPQSVMQHLQLRPGMQVEIELRDDGSFTIRPVEPEAMPASEEQYTHGCHS